MTDINKIRGIMPAAMTIWNSDESYNPKGMEKYLTWLLDNGAQCLSICGSTGENIAMGVEEQKQIMEHCLSFINHQVPVYVGTGKYSTKQTIELSQHAEKLGADGVLVILPYYLTPHKKAVMQHFRNLHAAINIDIMIYNNPNFAMYELTPLELKQLNDEGVIHSVKAAQGDVNRVHEAKYYCGDKLKVFYGNDYDAMEALLCGADGWLTGLPAILPRQCRELWNACEARDLDWAWKAQCNIQEFINYFIHDKVNGYPHWQEIFKYALQAQGLDFAGLPRLPLGELDAENKKKVDKLLENMDCKNKI